MRGRRPEIRVIEGGLSSVPPPPPNLPQDVRDGWDSIAADLIERKLLTESMLGTLEAYLTALWLVGQCRRTVAAEGMTVRTKQDQPKPHPLLGVMNKALETVSRLAAELGLDARGEIQEGAASPGRKKR